MGNKLVKREFIIGPPGPRGPMGDCCDFDYEINLPSAPAYPFPECGICEYVKGEKICDEIEAKDKFYVLAVRNDNTTYWKKIDLP